MKKELEISPIYVYVAIGGILATGVILYLFRHRIYKKFDYKTSYLLTTLDPDTRNKVSKCIVQNKKAGRDLRLIEAARSCERQDALYAQGRTTPGKIVTNAKCGQSAHNYRRAADIVEFKDGKPLWENPNWEEIGSTCETAGLQWGGRWKTKDNPHFEDIQGKSIAELYRGYQKTGRLIA